MKGAAFLMLGFWRYLRAGSGAHMEDALKGGLTDVWSPAVSTENPLSITSTSRQ